MKKKSVTTKLSHFHYPMTELETKFYQQFLEPGDYTRPPWLRGSGPAIHNSRALLLYVNVLPITND